MGRRRRKEEETLLASIGGMLPRKLDALVESCVDAWEKVFNPSFSSSTSF